MIKEKIKNLLGRNNQLEIIRQNKELEWAHIYHDSIRDKEWLKNLSLNIGRWAGNYSFFYVLNRVLNDYRPKKILEFGLGESSKVISTYLEHYLINSDHTIIEQDDNWRNHFNNHFKLSYRSLVHILPIQNNIVKGFETKGYKGIEEYVTEKYDLYIVDGPFGSINYSRYDIINIVKKLSKNDECIIILDDYNRKGEKQTFVDLIKIFKEKDMEVYQSIYEGTKSVAVIGTKKYQFIKSL